jgi:hypothetical protein
MHLPLEPGQSNFENGHPGSNMPLEMSHPPQEGQGFMHQHDQRIEHTVPKEEPFEGQ